MLEITLKSSKEHNYRLYLAIKTSYTGFFGGFFFLNTKYSYDSNTLMYPHRLKHTQQVQSPLSPFNSQNILQLALQSLVCFGTPPLPLLTPVCLSTSHSLLSKPISTQISGQLQLMHFAFTAEIRPCMCITDNLKLLQNGTL